MERSEQIGDLAGALAKAQGEMKSAAKDTQNTFYKSSYADLSAVMSACRVPLSKNGLAIIQTVDYAGEDIWLETTLAHSGGQWMRSKYPIRPVKNDPQGVGSAQTYARRYSLMAMVGIVADDDDDGNAAAGKGTNGNGYATSTAPEPAKQATAPKPDAEAAKWVNDAKAVVKGFDRIGDLRRWDDAPKTQDALNRLKAIDASLHREISVVIEDRYTALSPANA